jgi:hypothetical protein
VAGQSKPDGVEPSTSDQEVSQITIDYEFTERQARSQSPFSARTNIQNHCSKRDIEMEQASSLASDKIKTNFRMFMVNSHLCS